MGKAHATAPTSPDRLRHFKKYNECKQKPLYLHSPTKATTRSVGFAHEFQKYKKVLGFGFQVQH